MIQNYLKIAWRNLLRNKIYSFINIMGLATGLCCCLLMIAFIRFELSFDKFHSKAERIARVIMEYKIGNNGSKGNFTSLKVFPTFKENFPEVESGVRLSPTERLVKFEEIVVNEQNFLYADSTFFQVFDFQLLKGNPQEVLKRPKTIVLTASAAKKYFKDEDPIGKTLLISSRQDPYEVTGVVEDCPQNSQVKFDFVASLNSFGDLYADTYWNANYTTYLLLNSQEAIQTLEAKLKPFMKKELAEQEGVMINFYLESFDRIHLHSPYDAITPNTNIMYIYIVVCMALLVLTIACFTYINLSTARSVERAKEVGIRKVIGAKKVQLFFQFTFDSALITGLSLLLSIEMAILSLPIFNQITGLNLNIASFFDIQLLFISIGLFFIITLFAGSYPAFVISHFKPVSVLKGSFKSSKRGLVLSKSLIIFQFVISTCLILATLVVKNQMSFIQNKNLGYDRNHVLMVGLDGKMSEKIDLIKSELSSLPDVVATSSTYDTPLNIRGGYSMSGSDVSQSMGVTANPIDEQFLTATGIKLIAGQDLNQQDVKDASKQDSAYYHFILNQSAAKALGWTPAEAVGKKMYLGEDRPGEVKGVVADFHFASLHTAIKPLVLFPSNYGNTLIIKTKDIGNSQVLSAIEAKMKILAPHRPFEYKFMNDGYVKLYAAEKRTERIFNLFAGITLLLACIGLFGLSNYSIKQKIKEIGIRKVLGASVLQITTLLSKDFLKLVLIAFVVASPIAYYLMDKWLADFAYRITISWWIFAVAGISAVLIALIAVSWQSIKAAVANPVKSLRSE
jgi:putative ABC transport system permease protein